MKFHFAFPFFLVAHLPFKTYHVFCDLFPFLSLFDTLRCVDRLNMTQRSCATNIVGIPAIEKQAELFPGTGINFRR